MKPVCLEKIYDSRYSVMKEEELCSIISQK